MHAPDSPDRLRTTLKSWRVSPPADPAFRARVWQRIQAGAPDTLAGYLRAHLVGWSVAALLAVFAAGWTGRAVAQARIDSSRDQMVVSYLGNLDPRVLAKLRPE